RDESRVLGISTQNATRGSTLHQTRRNGVRELKLLLVPDNIKEHDHGSIIRNDVRIRVRVDHLHQKRDVRELEVVLERVSLVLSRVLVEELLKVLRVLSHSTLRVERQLVLHDSDDSQVSVTLLRDRNRERYLINVLVYSLTIPLSQPEELLIAASNDLASLGVNEQTTRRTRINIPVVLLECLACEVASDDPIPDVLHSDMR